MSQFGFDAASSGAALSPCRLRAARHYYAADRSGEVRYSPPLCTGTRVRIDRGNPDPDKISTSYVERQNFTMRMHMRRFTRLTNAFSKKVENHAAAVPLHFMHYNFARRTRRWRAHTRAPRRSPQALRIMSGRWQRSPPCWTRALGRATLLDGAGSWHNIPLLAVMDDQPTADGRLYRRSTLPSELGSGFRRGQSPSPRTLLASDRRTRVVRCLVRSAVHTVVAKGCRRSPRWPGDFKLRHHPRTVGARTSRCEWGCAGLRG